MHYKLLLPSCTFHTRSLIGTNHSNALFSDENRQRVILNDIRALIFMKSMILENHAMIYKAKCNTSETL